MKHSMPTLSTGRGVAGIMRIGVYIGFVVLVALVANAPASAQEGSGRTFSIGVQEPVDATIQADQRDFPSGTMSEAQTLALPMSTEDDDAN